MGRLFDRRHEGVRHDEVVAAVNTATSDDGRVFLEFDFGTDKSVVELARFDLKRLHIASQRLKLIGVGRRFEIGVIVERDLKCGQFLAAGRVPNQHHEMWSDGDRARGRSRGRELNAGQVDPGRRPRHLPKLKVIHEKRRDDLHIVDHTATGAGGGRRILGDQKGVQTHPLAMVPTVGWWLVADSSTKDLIVREARICFANQGFDGTSLNDIAAGVGIRRPSLLYYFPSKDAIYQHILELALTEWGRKIDERPTGDTDPWAQVDSILEVSFEFFRTNPEIVRIVRREALTDKGHLDFDLGTALRPYFLRAVRFFENEMEAGRFRRHDAEHLVLTGYGALLTYFSDHRMLIGLLDQDPFAPKALDARFAHIRDFVRSALEPLVTEPPSSGR